MTFINTNGYIPFGNPVSSITSTIMPNPSPFMMKSLFSNNSGVVYKVGSLSVGNAGSVRNAGIKSRRT
jgi:hypothetical protein